MDNSSFNSWQHHEHTSNMSIFILGPISEVGRLGGSDHVMLQFDLMVSGKVEEETRVIRN